MIKSFKHRGLERFFTTGSKAGILPSHARKLAEVLALLNKAQTVDAMNIQAFALHPLQGALAGRWSVKVNGNWRIIFRFIDGNAEVVDYLDYH